MFDVHLFFSNPPQFLDFIFLLSALYYYLQPAPRNSQREKRTPATLPDIWLEYPAGPPVPLWSL